MIEAVVVIAIALFILLLILLSTYNGLMNQRQDVRRAWADMDEALKQRYQLVPMLINTVQTTGGEAATKLAAVSAAKNQAAVAFNPTELARAEAALSIAIAEVLAAMEHDASPATADIRHRLLESEKQIDESRARYNQQVETLNASLGSFPQGLTAWLIGLKAQSEFASGTV
jgi:LemA protein